MQGMNHDIQARIHSHNHHISEIKNCMKFIMDIAENMEKYDLSDHVEIQRESMKTYITMELDMKDRITTLQKVLSGQLKATDTRTLEKVVEKQTLSLQKKRSDDYFNEHPMYKEFKKRVFAVKHPDELLSDDEDDGLLVVSQQVNIKCPLTKMIYEHPVKSTECGHIFEKEAILQLIASNRRRGKTGCPQPGCGRVIGTNYLVPDKDTEELVRRQKKEIEASQRIIDEDIVRL